LRKPEVVFKQLGFAETDRSVSHETTVGDCHVWDWLLRAALFVLRFRGHKWGTVGGKN